MGQAPAFSPGAQEHDDQNYSRKENAKMRSLLDQRKVSQLNNGFILTVGTSPSHVSSRAEMISFGFHQVIHIVRKSYSIVHSGETHI